MGSVVGIGGYFYWEIVTAMIVMGISHTANLVLHSKSWQVMSVLPMLGIGQWCRHMR